MQLRRARVDFHERHGRLPSEVWVSDEFYYQIAETAAGGELNLMLEEVCGLSIIHAIGLEKGFELR